MPDETAIQPGKVPEVEFTHHNVCHQQVEAFTRLWGKQAAAELHDVDIVDAEVRKVVNESQI